MESKLDNITKSDITDIKSNIIFNGNLITSSSNPYTNSNLVTLIEEFCQANGIFTKTVSESIIIYPKDYNNLNSSRIDLSDVYVELLSWSYEEDVEDNELIMTDFEWVIDDEIHSLDDLLTLLLKIGNTTQNPQTYYTKEEIEFSNSKKNKIQKQHDKEEKKRKKKFSKKLKKLNISKKDFFTLLNAYKISNNKDNWDI